MSKHGWTYKKLGEVTTKISDGSHNPPKGIDYSEYPMLSSKNVFFDCFNYDSPRYLSKEEFDLENKRTDISDGDILLTIVGTVGRTCCVKNPFIPFVLQRSVAVLKPKRSIIESRFLMYALHSLSDFWNIEAKGVAQKGIYLKQLATVPIPVPPIAEQKRIVAELDLLQGIIEKKKEQLKAYDQLAQSIFYTMFGDPIDNPKGWEVTTIGDTCSITCGQDYKSVEDENGKYPIYGTGGIMGWANQFKCPKNSIIIGRKGNINNPILVDVDFWNVDTAFGVTPNNEMLSAIYFYFFCKEYDFTQHDVSVTIPSLRRIDILKIKLPIPPLSLQEEFAEKVEAIEQQKELIRQSIKETEFLFNCRMDYRFN